MKQHPAWLATGLFVFAVLACNIGNPKNTNESTNSSTNDNNSGSHPSSSKSGVYVKEMHMAKDDGKGAPGDSTRSFSPGDRTIHCVATLNDSKSGTKMKFAWWIVDAEGTKNEKIKEIDYTTGALENVVHGHLTLPRDWPKGRYKCEVYINDSLDKTVEYTVE